jgi:hypothetical protein
MGTIFNDSERRRLVQRLRTLSQNTPRRWGKMTAHQMVCHLKDAVESGLHDSSQAVGRGVLARFPVKQLVIYILPWPKGRLQSPPELFTTSPTDLGAGSRGVRIRLGESSGQGAERDMARERRVRGAVWNRMGRSAPHPHQSSSEAVRGVAVPAKSRRSEPVLA